LRALRELFEREAKRKVDDQEEREHWELVAARARARLELGRAPVRLGLLRLLEARRCQLVVEDSKIVIQMIDRELRWSLLEVD